MKIALLGDVALFGKYSLKNNNVYEYFGEISKLLASCDHVIANLETPFCDKNCKSYGSKSAYIYSDENNYKILKYLNIDMVSLANNHIFDYGIKGYEKTKEVLHKNGIKYFGIENKDLLIEEKGNKIALSGYCCYSTNGVGYNDNKTNKGVNILDARVVEEKLKSYQNQKYFNIVSVHAGQEHVNYPNYDHIKLARKLAKNLNYVYYGNHPHVIQGIETAKNSLIAYSLGNFCFDDVYTDSLVKPFIKQSENNKKSFILILNIINSSLESHEIIPIYAGENKLEIDSEDKILKEISYYSEALKMEEQVYNQRRNKLFAEYLIKRKKDRDIKWFVKRLKLRYLMIYVNSKKNRIKYNKKIISYFSK